MKGILKKAVIVLAAIAGFFAVAIVRVYVEGEREYRRALDREGVGELMAAVQSYERSIRWYLPGAYYVRESVKRLLALAQRMEKAGDIDRALDIYRYLRSSLYAIRSTYQPYREIIRLCDERITAIMLERGDWPPRNLSRAERERMIREALQKNYDPSVFWTLLSAVFFTGWLAGVFGLALHGFAGGEPAARSGGKGGRKTWKRVLIWLAVIAACYVGWAVSLYLA